MNKYDIRKIIVLVILARITLLNSINGNIKFVNQIHFAKETDTFGVNVDLERQAGVNETIIIRCQVSLFRNTRPEVFCKKGVLRNFTKFTGKHLHQSLFFNKVAVLAPMPKCDFNKVALQLH